MKGLKKKILLICGGNTCRSPMAKAILEQKLKESGRFDDFMVDSAAYGYPTYRGASTNAREAIKRLFGEDLLASHKAKKLTVELAEQADLILVMEKRIKRDLPQNRTWTLKEYAGVTGDVTDPIGGDVDTYLICAKEISKLLDKLLTRL